MAHPYRGMDRAEANYYLAMHYFAGALWFVGAGTQALKALNDLAADAMVKSKESSVSSPQIGGD